MLAQQNTSACKMRDELIKARYEKKITPSEITDRLSKINIPDWLQAQIIQMVNYRKLERLTCAVELAMEAAVCRIILEEIINQNKQNDTTQNIH